MDQRSADPTTLAGVRREKLTGGGRELGEEGLASFQETKHVHWDLSGDVTDWWYTY